MENKKYLTISRKGFYVTLDGEKVQMPEFTQIATSRYRVFDEEDGNKIVLKKQCPDCQKWFNIAKYENMEWIEISNEEEYRKSNSGSYPTYCTLCSKDRNMKKSNSENSLQRFMNTDSKQKKDTVVWNQDIYEYIRIRSFLERISKNDFLNNLIIKEMSENPISIKFNNGEK